ncbi:MAG: PEGA domain-containing protein [Fidelibacterota bacterium]
MNHFLKIVYLLIIGYSNLFSQIKLDVSTIPKRVDVYLDGVNLGTSPVLNERIKPGLHKFEIKKKGFAPLAYDLLVNPAQAIKLDFFLNPIYKIKFKTEEKGLVFELNGEHRWDVPFIRLELEAGDHFLRVFKIGEIIDEQTIRVDEPKRFNYYLKKPLTSG